MPNIIDLTQQICEVPAPTGSEYQRAEFVADVLRARGYSPVVDGLGNVTSRRGSIGGPALMLLAHTDTVFPAGTELVVRRTGDTLHAPGIGDNSLGVAAMIEALTILDDLGVATDCDIIAVANVGEEGLGNLAGARAAVAGNRADIGAVVAIEGHNLGRVTHGAVGSVRLRITVSGRGGHSWGAFGVPSAIHVLAQIIAEIARITVPVDPKTTYNVGMIDGGVSINTIAPVATAMVDMRSIDAGILGDLVRTVTNIAESLRDDQVGIDIAVLGERPAGSCSIDEPLVQAASHALAWLGLDATFDASSTDANVPISLGIPAVCIGITTGGDGHTVNEYIDVPPIVNGVTQLALLCVEGCRAVASNRISD